MFGVGFTLFASFAIGSPVTVASDCSEAELKEKGCTGDSRLCSPLRPECYIIDQMETRITCRPPAVLMAQRFGVAGARRRMTISPRANRSPAPAPSPMGEPAAEVAWNSRIAIAVGPEHVRDGVGIHRHCTIARQGSPVMLAPVFRVMLVERENISCERSACTESRGAADLPEHVASLNRH